MMYRRIVRVTHFWVYALLVFIFSIIFFLIQWQSLRGLKARQDQILSHYDIILNQDNVQKVSDDVNVAEAAIQMGLDIKQRLALESLVEAVISKSVALADTDVEKNAIVEAKANAMFSETRDLLQMQFAKIQHEYEALEIWCGILTVIFLIFSFYSLFKTDDLVKQGREGLKELVGIRRNAEIEMKRLSKDGNNEISEFKRLSGESIAEFRDITSTRVRVLERHLENDRRRYDDTSQRRVEEMVGNMESISNDMRSRVDLLLNQTQEQLLQLKNIENEDVKSKLLEFQSLVEVFSQQVNILSSKVDLLEHKFND